MEAGYCKIMADSVPSEGSLPGLPSHSDLTWQGGERERENKLSDVPSS